MVLQACLWYHALSHSLNLPYGFGRCIVLCTKARPSFIPASHISPLWGISPATPPFVQGLREKSSIMSRSHNGMSSSRNKKAADRYRALRTKGGAITED